MKSVRFCINLKNGDHINIVECYLTEEAEKERFPQWFAEARATGLLITGTPETVQFFIPMENIAFVERIPFKYLHVNAFTRLPNISRGKAKNRREEKALAMDRREYSKIIYFVYYNI